MDIVCVSPEIEVNTLTFDHSAPCEAAGYRDFATGNVREGLIPKPPLRRALIRSEGLVLNLARLPRTFSALTVMILALPRKYAINSIQLHV